MRIATWNVNGVRAREKNVLAWLARENPDFLLMQEIKCEAAAFPASFRNAGWHAALAGQKGFNGVAILSRSEMNVSHPALPGLPADDAHARYIEIDVGGLRIGNLYLPNGNSGGEAGYEYKIRWMDSLYAHATGLLADDKPLILAGDYNVCPEDIDYAPGTLPPDGRPATAANTRALLAIDLGRADRRSARAETDRQGPTLSGTTRPVPGKRIAACASTTRCCRRRSPSGLSLQRRNGMSAARTRPPTMYR